MSYVQSSLTTGETIQHMGKLSLWSMLSLILLGLITLPLFGIGLLFLATAAIRYWTTELAITNKRVIAKTGLISRNTIELNLSKIESIRVDQSIMGRIFNYGSIIVAGAGNPQAPVMGISNPMNFRKAFISAQEGSERRLAPVN
ncbi:PH domain-containing protein [Hydrogenophaga sp. 2FB]|uniref:PH domain-containing protein n=1 Tax=Hydrogenophaga sp. 2FB TaxID=2502187 RepID=UPI0010F76755|nr:PH domain-containing protein [Hydrogenophaga sp. 2FB]